MAICAVLTSYPLVLQKSLPDSFWFTVLYGVQCIYISCKHVVLLRSFVFLLGRHAFIPPKKASKQHDALQVAMTNDSDQSSNWCLQRKSVMWSSGKTPEYLTFLVEKNSNLACLNKTFYDTCFCSATRLR